MVGMLQFNSAIRQPQYHRHHFERWEGPAVSSWRYESFFEKPMRNIAALLWIAVAATHAQEPRIAVISHRGEHLRHPENTLPAFRSAIEAGADFIEVDVRTTSDGKLVLMHDATVDRCTNGHGEVAKMTFEEIRKLDAGAKSGTEFAGTRAPTFQEVLELAKGRIGVY